MRGRQCFIAFDWSFLNAKDTGWGLFKLIGRLRLAGSAPKVVGEHVTFRIGHFIADPLWSFWREHLDLALPLSLLDIMPRPRMYSIEEVLNFTVKDIQGPK